MLTKFLTLFTVGLIVSNLTCFANEGMGTADSSGAEPVTSPMPSGNVASEAQNNPEVGASATQGKEQSKRDLARKRHKKGKHRRGHRKGHR